MSTWTAWSSTDRLRCSTPTPPWRAIAIAIRASVTVSIALDTSGIRSVIVRVSRVGCRPRSGMTSDAAGSSSTSSKVRPERARTSPGGRRPWYLVQSGAVTTSYRRTGRSTAPAGERLPWQGDATTAAGPVRRRPGRPGRRCGLEDDGDDIDAAHRRTSGRTCSPTSRTSRCSRRCSSRAGVRGLVVDCEDCGEPHYFGWDLLRGNLRHLLDEGRRACTSRRSSRTRRLRQLGLRARLRRRRVRRRGSRVRGAAPGVPHRPVFISGSLLSSFPDLAWRAVPSARGRQRQPPRPPARRWSGDRRAPPGSPAKPLGAS